MSDDVLSIIQEDNQSSVKRRCNAMFSKWLKVDTNASWRKIFLAIDNCTRAGQRLDQGN